MDEEKKTIELKYPITMKTKDGGDVKISEIQIGRFKLGHVKLLPKNFSRRKEQTLEPHELIPVIAGLSGLDAKTIEQLDLDDLDQIGGVISDFFASSLGTGKKSSGQRRISTASSPAKSGR